MPYGDVDGRKARPVVVYTFDDTVLVVSPMYSQDHTSNTRYHLQVSQESADSYDRKGTRGYIAMTTVLRLPFDAVIDRGREPGQLSLRDRKRLVAALIEWEVD